MPNHIPILATLAVLCLLPFSGAAQGPDFIGKRVHFGLGTRVGNNSYSSEALSSGVLAEFYAEGSYNIRLRADNRQSIGVGLSYQRSFLFGNALPDGGELLASGSDYLAYHSVGLPLAYRQRIGGNERLASFAEVGLEPLFLFGMKADSFQGNADELAIDGEQYRPLQFRFRLGLSFDHGAAPSLLFSRYAFHVFAQPSALAGGTRQFCYGLGFSVGL